MEIENDSPIIQYCYGDSDDFALTIDVFPNGETPYQARLWSNGDTGDLSYHSSFEDCIAWFRELEPKADHGMPAGQEPRVVGVAPRSTDGGETISWTLVDSAHVDTWWDGSDYPEKNIRGETIILFDDMIEDADYAVVASGPKL